MDTGGAWEGRLGPRVVVTGGAGFIGRHVCAALLSRGCAVTALDANLGELGTQMQGLQVDLRDGPALAATLRAAAPEAIVHLAALPLVVQASADPALVAAINVDGSRRLLEEVGQLRGVRRFVFVSSSTVYGDFRYSPADEAHPTVPIEPYGRTKLLGEQLTRQLCADEGIEHVIVRPTAVYGPDDRHRRVVLRLIEQALAGEALTIDGDGSQRLDFTYVGDLAAGIALALLTPAARDETFNLARGEERSLLELAEIIRSLLPSVTICHRASDGPRRPTRGAVAIDKARRLLGFSPETKLEAGIAQCLAAINKGLLD